MALPMQKENVTFVAVGLEEFRPEPGAQRPAFGSEAQPALARPDRNVDWSTLMVETEAEWHQTLDYLGR